MPLGKTGSFIVACLLVPVTVASAQVTQLDERSIADIWNALRSNYQQGYALPSDFATRPSSEVALEFVEQGRSDKHRKHFNLTFPDKPEQPPQSGWLVFKEIPHSCWVSRKEITVLSLNPANPRLIIGDHLKRSDLFKTNPTESTNGYGLRIIELTPQQAETIIEMIWALRQVQTKETLQLRGRWAGSSSADSAGYLYLEGAETYLGRSTIWYTDPIQESWRAEYDEESFLNFAAHFIGRGIPALLKDQWQPSSLRRSSRMTTSFRTQNREQLTRTITILLQEHQHDPLPSQLLAFLVEAIGECGLTHFKEPLLALKASLPPLTGLEEFLSKNSSYDAKIEDYKLFRKRNLTTLDLRKAISQSFTQFEALNSDQKLASLARNNYSLEHWARRKLLFSDSRIARDFHLRCFYDAPHNDAKSYAMENLALYSPKLTRSLISDLSERRWREFAPDFAPVLTTPHERLEQTLKDLALDTKLSERRRAEAIKALGNIKPGNRRELAAFLVGSSGTFTNNPRSTDKCRLLIDTIEALLAQEEVADGWALTRKALSQEDSWSSHQLPALALKFLEKDPTLKTEVESALVEALNRFPSLTDQVALLTLHLDLPAVHETISKQEPRSLEMRLATLFHAQKTPFDRFVVLSSWAIQSHWVYDTHPTLHLPLESLAQKSPAEQVLAFLNQLQARTDHDGYELILRLKSLVK